MVYTFSKCSQSMKKIEVHFLGGGGGGIKSPIVNEYQIQKKFLDDFLKSSKTCQYLSFGGGL